MSELIEHFGQFIR